MNIKLFLHIDVCLLGCFSFAKRIHSVSTIRFFRVLCGFTAFRWFGFFVCAKQIHSISTIWLYLETIDGNLCCSTVIYCLFFMSVILGYHDTLGRWTESHRLADAWCLLFVGSLSCFDFVLRCFTLFCDALLFVGSLSRFDFVNQWFIPFYGALI